MFSIVALYVVAALVMARSRFWTDLGPYPFFGPIASGVTDAFTLRHLHDAGDCTTAEESRGPWRRWFHHCTFHGFALCFASTTIAAVYHLVFGWYAPYSYSSLPVVLGTAGGVGLLIGPAGLLAIGRRRDPNLGDAAERGLDIPFTALLFLASLTGLVLLVLRDRGVMPALLIVHLAIVLALFLTLPYGKFVHGMYRTAALIKFSHERRGGA